MLTVVKKRTTRLLFAPVGLPRGVSDVPPDPLFTPRPPHQSRRSSGTPAMSPVPPPPPSTPFSQGPAGNLRSDSPTQTGILPTHPPPKVSPGAKHSTFRGTHPPVWTTGESETCDSTPDTHYPRVSRCKATPVQPFEQRPPGSRDVRPTRCESSLRSRESLRNL